MHVEQAMYVAPYEAPLRRLLIRKSQGRQRTHRGSLQHCPRRRRMKRVPKRYTCHDQLTSQGSINHREGVYAMYRGIEFHKLQS